MTDVASRAARTGAEEAPARRRTTPGRRRAWLMLPAAVAMLAGLDAGLVLLGVPAPVRTDRLPVVHGMLMTLGFVGTLICLERAVALRRRVALVAPALLGLGSVLLLAPIPIAVGQSVLLAGTVAMGAVYVPLWRRQRDDAVLVEALGVVLAVGAATLWLGGTSMPLLVPWLAGFLVLTIAGERLELARLAMGPSAGRTLVVLAAAVLGATVAALLWPAAGSALLGVALLTLTLWLARHDVARRTVRDRGLTRFMATSMLAGYVWLAVAGVVWLLGPAVSGPAYDAVIHAVFLGFTISMVMAHAPVIMPAVLRRPLPWHPVLWLPLGLLHLSLAVRLYLGDARGVHVAWQVGGVLNEVALLAFAALIVWSLRPTRRRAR
ncbi:hypothetical protein AB3X52_17070 [Nocardioides sp. DS6]|uniref:NnrS family protein n=1 Tax=Nocardioides eburneus TaxID=3231482 RepID=A0ABV3T3S5_9ACTN